MSCLYSTREIALGAYVEQNLVLSKGKKRQIFLNFYREEEQVF